jgi:hypothetical protein
MKVVYLYQPFIPKTLSKPAERAKDFQERVVLAPTSHFSVAEI